MHSVLHAFTHSVVWASVLASAVVAAVVTLLVEYIAKPSLEARKERILEDRREWRIGLKEIKRAENIILALISLEARFDPDDTLAEYLTEQKNELMERMNRANELLDVPDSIAIQWAKTQGHVTAFAIGLHKGAQSRELVKTLRVAAGSLFRFYEYFKTPKWRWRRQLSLVRRINSAP